MPGLLVATSGLPLTGTGAIPAYSAATGVASGPTFGTGYTKTSGFTGTPSSMTYDDPYLAARAPEYVNWSFGIQRQFTNTMALTLSYVGSEGHFLQLDSFHARGLLVQSSRSQVSGTVGSHLADTGSTATTVTADCTTFGLSCPGLSNFATSQPLSTLLKPYPFQSVS